MTVVFQEHSMTLEANNFHTNITLRSEAPKQCLSIELSDLPQFFSGQM